MPPEIQEKIRDLEQELNEGMCGWARRSGRYGVHLPCVSWHVRTESTTSRGNSSRESWRRMDGLWRERGSVL